MTYEEFLKEKNEFLEPQRLAYEQASERLRQAQEEEDKRWKALMTNGGDRCRKKYKEAVELRKKSLNDEREAYKELRLASERWHGLQR